MRQDPRAQPTSQDIQDQRKFAADVKRLARNCAGFLYDLKEREQDGWTIHYAIDADVVAMYMAPGTNRPHAAVFKCVPHDDADTVLARLLSDYIFKRLKTGNPAHSEITDIGSLLVIPPHDSEIHRMILALQRREAQQVSEAVPALDGLLEWLSTLPPNKSDDEILAELVNRGKQVVEILDGQSGPSSELSRFKSMPAHRLLAIERFELPAIDWPRMLPDLRSESPDLTTSSDYFTDWQQRISAVKSARQSSLNVRQDAFALAYLQFVNQRLFAYRHRVILITGTQGIHLAAANAPADGKAGPGPTFADLYIRHPLAFIAEREFFASSQNAEDEGYAAGTFSLVNWLNLSFPELVSPQEGGLASINWQALKELEAVPDSSFSYAFADFSGPGSSHSSAARSVVDEWRTQVLSTGIARASVQPQWEQRAAALWAKLKAVMNQQVSLEELRAQIGEVTLRSLNELYSSSAWIGIWNPFDRVPGRDRGFPALRFDDYSAAQTYYQRVRGSLLADALDLTEPKEAVDIGRIYADLSVQDPSHYLGHVIHAYAYAMRGHLYATTTLCELAMRTVDRTPRDRGDERRGREAAYLLAIAERRMARKLEDLSRAQNALTEALRRESETKTSAGIDLRFRCEQLALDVARVNFVTFLQRHAAERASLSADSLLQTIDQLQILLGEIDLEDAEDVRSWLRQQAVTNAINSLLIGMYLRLLDPTLPAQRAAAFLPIIYNGNSVEHDGLRRVLKDPVADFLFAVGVACFSDDPDQRQEAAQQVAAIDYPCVRPFDAERKRVFRALAEAARERKG